MRLRLVIALTSAMKDLAKLARWVKTSIVSRGNPFLVQFTPWSLSSPMVQALLTDILAEPRYVEELAQQLVKLKSR